MRIVFKAFEDQLDGLDLGSKKAVSKPGIYILDLLRDSKLGKDNAGDFLTTLDNVLQVPGLLRDVRGFRVGGVWFWTLGISSVTFDFVSRP